MTLGAAPDALLAALAAEQWGVVTLADALRCGLSRKTVTGRVTRGSLHVIYRGVYALGHPGISFEGRMLAAVRACGDGAVLSHFAAAALWGLVEWPEGRLPEVTVRKGGVRGKRGIRVHRTAILEARDVTRRGGIPVTTPARTLIDLAAIVPEPQLRRAVRQAFADRRLRVATLTRELPRFRRRHGVARLSEILADGFVPTVSELEDVVYGLIVGAGFEPPDVNRPLRIAGRTVIPDFRWPSQRLIVEADGAKWHDNGITKADDAHRQALLESAGETVLRVTWHQAVGAPTETIGRLVAAGAPKRRPVR